MKCVAVGLAALLLVGCDFDEPRRMPTALVVVTTQESESYACASDREPLQLGKADRMLLSPDGTHLVMQGDIMEIVSLADGTRVQVPGDAPTLEGARWSPDSRKLGYLDRGLPMLVRRDGSEPIALDVELPPPSDNYSAQAVEWARDGTQVAFVTRGLGILANPKNGSAGVFSASMLGSFASPWALTFSADGRMLAGLDTVDGERSVVMIDTQTLQLWKAPGINYYSFLGWTGDDVFAVVWSLDSGSSLWLVPREGPTAFASSARGMPSPAGSEIALYGDGLHVVDPISGGDRSLLPDSWNVQGLKWSYDGKAIGYDAGKRRGYVSAEDGTRLVDGLGVLSPSGWVATAAPDDPASTLLVQNLWQEGGARLAMRNPDSRGAGEMVTRSTVRWLSEARLAYASDDGVHFAHADGQVNRVICGVAGKLAIPQGDTFEDRADR